MTVIKKGDVIILEHTSLDQLEALKKLIGRAAQKIPDDVWDKESRYTFEQECVYHGLINFCADLEVDGYEM